MLADRGEPASPGRKELGTLAREALAKAYVWVTSPLGGQPGPARPGRGDRTPVLLVADAGHGRAALGGLARFLRQRGHRWVLIAPTGRGSLKERAQALDAAVRELRDASGQPEFDIVAHGIGGLVAGWWMRHVAAEDRVGRFVSLGTPWAGTRMAAFARGPIARETLPGSHLLDELAPPAERLVCIWGSLDPMVLPLQSAVIERATSVKLSGAGHVDMLFSARAYRAVATALAGEDSAGPAASTRYAPDSPETS